MMMAKPALLTQKKPEQLGTSTLWVLDGEDRIVVVEKNAVCVSTEIKGHVFPSDITGGRVALHLRAHDEQAFAAMLEASLKNCAGTNNEKAGEGDDLALPGPPVGNFMAVYTVGSSIFLLENFATEEAQDHHGTKPHFLQFRSLRQSLLVSKRLTMSLFWNPKAFCFGECLPGIPQNAVGKKEHIRVAHWNMQFGHSRDAEGLDALRDSLQNHLSEVHVLGVTESDKSYLKEICEYGRYEVVVDSSDVGLTTVESMTYGEVNKKTSLSNAIVVKKDVTVLRKLCVRIDDETPLGNGHFLKARYLVAIMYTNNSGILKVFAVVHLSGGIYEDRNLLLSPDLRERQAERVADILRFFAGGCPCLLVGDFNAAFEYKDTPVAAYLKGRFIKNELYGSEKLREEEGDKACARMEEKAERWMTGPLQALLAKGFKSGPLPLGGTCRPGIIVDHFFFLDCEWDGVVLRGLVCVKMTEEEGFGVLFHLVHPVTGKQLAMSDHDLMYYEGTLKVCELD
jgi:hypothetical protein